ncbi:MAG: hypothetical protein KTR32_27125 [Granulosicoccus sp.]|nr:hypothetical protein [Granulosicoccus sp.]
MLPDPITGAAALAKNSAKKLLLDIIDHCHSQLVLFDLDSTLLDNRPRSAYIMREFAAERNLPLLAEATPEHFPTWSAHNSMRLLGLTESDANQIIDGYLEFWASRFFTSDYCSLDVPINGAVNFVRAVHRAGGIVTYLTGRDETMRAGTLSSLEKHGFVLSGTEQSYLIMKSEAEISDDDYKKNALQKIVQRATVAAAFDNEPTHINSYREVFPDSICVHLDTDHSMRHVRLLPGIVSISDFEH